MVEDTGLAEDTGLVEERATYVVATFYKFVALPDVDRWQALLQAECERAEIKGTILLASEGLNATIAGEPLGVEQIIDVLRADARFADMMVKRSAYDRRPFQRLKVRIKTEIVTIGDVSVDPTHQVGQYVAPSEWNRMLDDPEVTVIDTRNDFEVAIGTFDQAINPDTKSFREFTSYVDNELSPQSNPKVALFCTGGIRCEKATSYLLDNGFEDVFHLEGGILQYLAEVDEHQSRWNGNCFVFDERVAVGHGVTPASFELCATCGDPFEADDLVSRDFETGLCCSECRDAKAESVSKRSNQAVGE